MPRTITRRKTTTTANGTKVVTLRKVEAPDLEWRLQAASVRRLRARHDYDLEFTLAGDFAAGRRSPQEATKAKATGLTPGDPDLRVYAANGRLLMIELKAKSGKPSDDQLERHALLIGFGYMVVTIHASTEDECADLVEATVEEWLAMGGVVANDGEPCRLAA
ncbi:MAG: VRR-NUC domain-containing protein [Ferrovibrio sp.]|uniref:VRR-NUC domain-containing protein n=1 Tax=Ferrovibrio sp. TaxID=1917215 RepID=UPI002619B391|nr:VRR-NUC domain-containing protein [Ferrovibrio sp.]MCW0235263.1 VRR-NUC domain-containing protein [Ferrovibrio sp.]